MSRSKPSVLFVNQHYYPDFASTGQHLTDLAEHLVVSGLDVSVLCSRGKYLAGDLEVPDEEVHNGVRIHRVRASSFGRGTHLGRLADYATFYFRTIGRLMARNRYDYVVFLTTPPLLSLIGGMLKRTKGQKYGIWSMDLHPDAEEEAGMIRKGGPVAAILHGLNNFGYRNADFVVDLGSYMKRRLMKRGVDDARLHTIPVWSRAEEVAPIDEAENPLMEELGLRGKFVLMYSGNAGVVHRFQEVCEAMRRLKDDEDIFFLFVGAGPRRAEIEQFAVEHRVTNFRYLDYFDRSMLRYSLSLADVHLLTLQDTMAGVAVPGKLYGVMGAARPVLMVGPRASESAETILSADCGVVVDPTQAGADPAAEIVDALNRLRRDPALCKDMGSRGRQEFLRTYEKEVACDQWTMLLKSVAGTVHEPIIA